MGRGRGEGVRCTGITFGSGNLLSISRILFQTTENERKREIRKGNRYELSITVYSNRQNSQSTSFQGL